MRYELDWKYQDSKLSLWLTKYHSITTYWGSECVLQLIPNLGTGRRCVFSFTPWPLYCREKAPGTHWIGGWVGLIAGLDAVAKRKNLIFAPVEN